MPIYEFRCDVCGNHDAYLPFSGNLHVNECPTCRKPTKRVYHAIAHRWEGFKSPTLEIDQSKRRLENNKKIYGVEKAEAMELKNKKHRSQKVIDPFD